MTSLGTTASDAKPVDPDHAHPHAHQAGEGHADHPHDVKHSAGGGSHTIELQQRILAKNDDLAERNRAWLGRQAIIMVNLMSSPGAGKTTLLERTIKEADRPIAVIEGDQETVFDAERIRAAGARAVQVNTGAGCHLDAAMVERALGGLHPEAGNLVFVENVGNLVCPALFDLGEDRKVVIISVTEGDDKPLKYPHMFAAADLVVVNKIDLLPYVDFNIERLGDDARQLNPGLQIMPLSARTGEGMSTWHDWLPNV